MNTDEHGWKRARRATLAVGLLILSIAGQADAAELPAPWASIWSREKGAVSAGVDEGVRHAGTPALRVEHRGEGDWALMPRQRLAVREGDIVELTAAVRVEGQGVAQLSAALYDAKGEAVDWMAGEARAETTAGAFRELRSRLIAPAGVATALPRITGHGPAVVHVAGFAAKKEGNVADLREQGLPARVEVRNAALAVALDTASARFEVTDLRSKRSFPQAPGGGEVVILSARAEKETIHATLLHVPTAGKLSAEVRLDGTEVVVQLTGDGPLTRRCAWPQPFASSPGWRLVVPMNEGIGYPVDEEGLDVPDRLIAYGGHGICMPFFGAADDGTGAAWMGILLTPDDASVRLRRGDGMLTIGPEWEGQKGKWGYARSVRYAFFGSGGHVAIAKRYRRHAQETGLLVTLAEKRKANPHVDLLVGAVNVWCFDRDPAAMAAALRDAGIDRILWSSAASPANLAKLNAIPGVLTGRYDIVQDVMDPSRFGELRGRPHADWTTAAWPDDLMRSASGDWIRGWQVRMRDGSMVPCGVLCDRQAPPYAQKRLAEELATHPYRARFMDTTTASPWRECHDERHPLTRSQSRTWKMKLLDVLSKEFNLVTGSETGHDAAVPHVHYFEGMMSLGPYRVPDAGRDIQRIWDEVPERVAKYQLGHRYRLPLWELVYHDCVVSHWYWGDYSNKLPALWEARDRFNALYGAPPMFMFRRELWEKERARFVQSYQASAAITRATGYAEMTDHRVLTADRDVQRTTFANGVRVTVNFADAPRTLPDGTAIPAGAIRTEGLPAAP